AETPARAPPPAFAEGVAGQIASASLPAGVGCLHIRKKPHLFLLEDVGKVPPPRPEPEKASGGREAPVDATEQGADAPRSPEPDVDFARLFDQAFERLDQEHGSPNPVSLVRLRPERPVGRGTFAAGLCQVRALGPAR